MNEYNHHGKSVLVSNMATEAREMEVFPVLIGDEIANFHSVRGGYNWKLGCSVVNFVHEIQGPGSPYMVNTDEMSHEIEAHLSENYYHLNVEGLRAVGDYPDEEYVLSMRVVDHMFGEHSFSEVLSTRVDKRQTEINYEDI